MSDRIVDAVLRHLNAWADKPSPIALDTLDKQCPAMVLRQLSGTVVERRFVDGGFIGRWPFAVCMRVDGRDTQSRLAAVRALMALGESLRDAPLPEIGGGCAAVRVEMVGLPSQVAAYADGAEEYQAVYALWYRQQRGQ